MMANDLSGCRFGRLSAIERQGSRRNNALWLCRCDCGNELHVISGHLRSGHTQSCGCAHQKHGHTSRSGSSPTYRSWANMVGRCTQPSSPAFAYYQSQGVTICERWRSFENFLADMGERPTLGHSIDRHPDMTGNYEPGNCRWATKKQQANNRKDNTFVEFRGTQMTIADLARFANVPYELLQKRIVRFKWPIEEAVTRPLSRGRRRDLGR